MSLKLTIIVLIYSQNYKAEIRLSKRELTKQKQAEVITKADIYLLRCGRYNKIEEKQLNSSKLIQFIYSAIISSLESPCIIWCKCAHVQVVPSMSIINTVKKSQHHICTVQIWIIRQKIPPPIYLKKKSYFFLISSRCDCCWWWWLLLLCIRVYILSTIWQASPLKFEPLAHTRQLLFYFMYLTWYVFTRYSECTQNTAHNNYNKTTSNKKRKILNCYSAHWYSFLSFPSSCSSSCCCYIFCLFNILLLVIYRSCLVAL